MPSYSKRSKQKLGTCHQDLQTIFNYVIKKYDNTIVYGVRTSDQQFSLYKKGRELVGDVWVIVDKRQVVTYKDGVIKKSKHQAPDGEVLSLAVDAVPYHPNYPHIRWRDTKAILHFGGYVRGVADMLFKYGDIPSQLVYGADWDDDFVLDDQTFFDGVHFQLKL